MSDSRVIKVELEIYHASTGRKIEFGCEPKSNLRICIVPTCSSKMLLAKLSRIWFLLYSCTDISKSWAFWMPIPQNVRYRRKISTSCSVNSIVPAIWQYFSVESTINFGTDTDSHRQTLLICNAESEPRRSFSVERFIARPNVRYPITGTKRNVS